MPRARRFIGFCKTCRTNRAAVDRYRNTSLLKKCLQRQVIFSRCWPSQPTVRSFWRTIRDTDTPSCLLFRRLCSDSVGSLAPGEDMHYAFDVSLTSTATTPEPGTAALALTIAPWFYLVWKKKGKTK